MRNALSDMSDIAMISIGLMFLKIAVICFMSGYRENAFDLFLNSRNDRIRKDSGKGV